MDSNDRMKNLELRMRGNVLNKQTSIKNYIVGEQNGDSDETHEASLNTAPKKIKYDEDSHILK